MRIGLKFVAAAAGLMLAAGMSAPAANAAAFGPAGIGFNVSATVTTVGATSTSLSSQGVSVTTGSQTGMFATGNTYGSSPVSNTAAAVINGTIQYSGTVGQTVTTGNSITDYLNFTANDSSKYQFDLSSVQTIFYQTSGVSRFISLYLLGSMSDTTDGLSGTATSITLTMSSNNSGANWQVGGTLANPPAPSGVPEPMSMAVMGVALAGLGLVRRRKSA